MLKAPTLIGGTRTEPTDPKSASYLMGRTERERRRLLLQGSILNPGTERFLRAAGLSPGMRVLDIGCGIGDVSLIAARIVGPAGRVTGIDLDEQALDAAKQRSTDERCGHVSFERADLTQYHPDGPFDAVVARHVLIHVSDPLGAVLHAASILKVGGLAAFEEYDLSFWPPGYPQTPLIAALNEALVAVFRRVSPHANIGMQLSCLLQEAGFSTPQANAECLMEGDQETNFYEWLAQTTFSVLPVMEKLGLADPVGDPDTLAERVREEAVAARAYVTSPLIVRTFARKSE